MSKLPDPIPLPFKSTPLLAYGSEAAASFCLTDGERAYVSPNLGNLRNPAEFDIYNETISAWLTKTGIQPEAAVCDLHPDYITTRSAEKSGYGKVVPVQHHHAHAAACMVENNLNEKVIAVTFDGMGLGDDGTVWGGEFLVCDYKDYKRAGHLKSYPLPGGDQATLFPERMAYSMLSTELGDDGKEIEILLPHMSAQDKKMLSRMLEKNLNCPLSSSAGRLFDAAAAMLGFAGEVKAAAEAAIGLEQMAAENITETYSYEIKDMELSFGPVFNGICCDLEAGVDKGMISAKFHNTLAAAAIAMCEKIRESEGLNVVVLSGGVFYNNILSRLVNEGLKEKNFSVSSHKLLSPGDICLSLGQAAVAGTKLSTWNNKN
ncbi:MAG: Kae1-like domain-containing protein [Planctomycetota bacterium]